MILSKSSSSSNYLGDCSSAGGDKYNISGVDVGADKLGSSGGGDGALGGDGNELV